jgi:hypothetical protein
MSISITGNVAIISTKEELTSTAARELVAKGVDTIIVDRPMVITQRPKIDEVEIQQCIKAIESSIIEDSKHIQRTEHRYISKRHADKFNNYHRNR